VMLLHQGPIGCLDLRTAGRGGHPQYLIGVASGRKGGQGESTGQAILSNETGPGTTNKKPLAVARGWTCNGTLCVRRS